MPPADQQEPAGSTTERTAQPRHVGNDRLGREFDSARTCSEDLGDSRPQRAEVDAVRCGFEPLEGQAGQSVGVTLDEQLFIERGELVSHEADAPIETNVFRARLFWLGQKAGKKAINALNEATEDPDRAVKKKAVFALSQLPRDEAVPQLIHVADTNKDPAIRKEAMFWLGQTKDPRALDYFEKVLKR